MTSAKDTGLTERFFGSQGWLASPQVCWRLPAKFIPSSAKFPGPGRAYRELRGAGCRPAWSRDSGSALCGSEQSPNRRPDSWQSLGPAWGRYERTWRTPVVSGTRPWLQMFDYTCIPMEMRNFHQAGDCLSLEPSGVLI